MRWEHRDDAGVWVVLEPGDELTLDDVVRQADEHGCGGLDLDAVAAVLADGAPRRVGTVDETHSPGGLVVEASSDGLSATVDVHPPGARRPRFTRKDLDDALADAGVRLGVDQAALRAIRLDLPGSHVVAHGWAPTAGRGGYLEYVVSVDHELRHEVGADGSVDFHPVARMPNVRAGQLLAVLVPPLPGTPGRDVRGGLIEAPAGEPATFPEGDNVWISEDGTGLHAGIDGLLEIVGEKVSVRPDLVIEGDVDYSTGSIDFTGDVVIRGSVLPDFSVRATGKVVVLGDVEQASVEASTLVWVRGAVIGDRSRIACDGNVKIGSVREGRVEAGESALIERETLEAHILAGTRVVLQSARNRLAGGRVHAGAEVIAGEIGSVAGIPTEITIGRSPQEVEQVTLLEAELREHAAVLERVAATIAPLRADTSLMDRMTGRRRDAARRLLELEGSLRSRVEEITERLEQLARPEVDEQAGRVVARQVLRRSVRLRCGSEVITTSQDQFRVMASQVGGRLKVAPISEQSAAAPALAC